MTSTLFALAILAQVDATPTAPPPQPTPPPGWTRLNPDGSPQQPTPAPTQTPAPAPATGGYGGAVGGNGGFTNTPDGTQSTDHVTLPDDYNRPMAPPRHRELLQPGIVPTIGAGLVLRSRLQSQTQDQVSAVDDVGDAGMFWIGLGMLPEPQEWAPFYSLSAEVQFHQTVDNVSFVEWTPTVRVGLDGLRHPFNEYVNQVFPNVELYAIGGWRVPNPYEPGAARVGIGVTSPLVAGALIAMARDCVPIPTMLEGTVDLDGRDAPQYSLRFGWSF